MMKSLVSYFITTRHCIFKPAPSCFFQRNAGYYLQHTEEHGAVQRFCFEENMLSCSIMLPFCLFVRGLLCFMVLPASLLCFLRLFFCALIG